MPAEICEYLDWDSSFFARRIARTKLSRFTPESIVEVVQWCSCNRIECIYFLAAADDSQTISLAETNGFRLVDVRMTLKRHLGAEPVVQEAFSGYSVRRCQPEDIPRLRNIAATNHRDSRFYFDGHFSTEQCDALYEAWIERSATGWADAVLVAIGGQGPVGYVTCHLSPDRSGSIGLVGVSSSEQGNGLGRLLVTAALEDFRHKDVGAVTVVTQGRNCKAQRLYQRCGFVTFSVELWFHRWFRRRNEDIEGDSFEHVSNSI